MPLSIQDLIYLDVCKAIRLNDELKFQEEKLKNESETVKAFYLAICDIRTLLLDTNTQSRICAIKDTKQRRLTPFEVENLPSVKDSEAERKKHMTEEELAQEEIKEFMAGKVIKAR